MQTPIRDEVRNYIVQNLLSGDPRGFTDETDLQETAILNSFATLELLHHLESTFQIELGPGQIKAGSFKSVDSIARMVEEAMS